MSVNIEVIVHTNEWDPLAIRLENAPLGVARQFIREYPPILLGAMKNRTPSRRGNLRASERVEPIDDMRSQITWSHIGKFVDQPTRPHVIRATRARALRFFIGGRRVYAKSVHHPGTEGEFIRVGAMEDTRPDLNDLLRSATAKELGAR